jgi:hypothetical protein
VCSEEGVCMYVHWRGQGMCVYGGGDVCVCVCIGCVCLGEGVCMCMYWVWALSGGGFTGRCMRRDGTYMLVCVLVL